MTRVSFAQFAYESFSEQVPDTFALFFQGTHLLIGEEKYRGKHRFTACMVSLKHACFLRDPRTEVVVGEPRYDLDIIPLLATFLPQEVRKEVELPHKRAVFVSALASGARRVEEKATSDRFLHSLSCVETVSSKRACSSKA